MVCDEHIHMRNCHVSTEDVYSLCPLMRRRHVQRGEFASWSRRLRCDLRPARVHVALLSHCIPRILIAQSTHERSYLCVERITNRLSSLCRRASTVLQDMHFLFQCSILATHIEPTPLSNSPHLPAPHAPSSLCPARTHMSFKEY